MTLIEPFGTGDAEVDGLIMARIAANVAIRPIAPLLGHIYGELMFEHASFSNIQASKPRFVNLEAFAESTF